VIFPEERSLFPREIIFPFYGIGKMPEDKFFKTVLYQVNAQKCPHLKPDELSICKIYEKRPLACRSFPFLYLASPFEVLGPDFARLAVWENCLFVQKSKVRNPHKIEAFNERKAAEQMALKLSIREGPQWLFDLKEQEWVYVFDYTF